MTIYVHFDNTNVAALKRKALQQKTHFIHAGMEMQVTRLSLLLLVQWLVVGLGGTLSWLRFACWLNPLGSVRFGVAMVLAMLLNVSGLIKLLQTVKLILYVLREIICL